jgi:nitroreductase
MNYNEFLELVSHRYSCRNFSDERVGRDVVKSLLEAARLAPSACNKQPWSFIVADTDASLATVRSAYTREWFAGAPVVIVALGDHSNAWHRQYDGKDATDIDLSIACEHITLAATSLGLGSCWVCAFDKQKIIDGFGLPADVEPIALIPVGHPADPTTVPAKVRKNIDEIVKWGKF